MSKHLPCSIVRDLLPSYVEGLTEEETGVMIQNHLNECPECAKRYAAMKDPESLPEETEQEEKQVDYLKILRKKNLKRIIAAVIAACLLILAAVAGKLFFIGSPVESGEFGYTADYDEEKEELSLNLYLFDSSHTFTGWDIDTIGSTIELHARKVLVSPTHGTKNDSVRFSVAQADQVTVLGETVWERGLLVGNDTNNLLQHRIPYVGDAAALGQLSNLLPLPNVPSTMELQTSAEPYGYILHFEEPLTEGQEEQMERCAYLLLALVDNLGEVRWTYLEQDDHEMEIETLNLMEANENLIDLAEDYNERRGTEIIPLPNVKNYAESSAALQQLRELVGI